jgi:outer membrane protein
MRWLVLLSLLLSPSMGLADPTPLDADACVSVAVNQSGKITEEQGRIEEWKGRIEEADAVYMPRIAGLSYVAPMYGVHGDGYTRNYRIDLTQWGPYVHFESTLVKPFTTFGQAESGKHAAEERLAVEQAQMEIVRNTISMEVRRYYYTYLYAVSLKPTITQAKKLLDEAQQKAQEEYDSGSGKVTNVDLMKLRYAASELQKALVQQQIGVGLALAALKHTMGLPDDAPLVLADEVLPDEPEAPVPDLATLLRVAAEKRPETAQIRHGKEAALAFERTVRMANRPAIFLAGQLGINYAPTRDHDNNPWHTDPYNGIGGGVALGLKFDLDFWGAAARGNSAHGLVDQVAGLTLFAQTGLPLEVRKARDMVVQAHDLLVAATDGALATKKWMLFAGTAYSAGTGEPRDVLEGVAAYVQAKKSYFDILLSVHTSRAELRYAIGDAQLPGVK